MLSGNGQHCSSSSGHSSRYNQMTGAGNKAVAGKKIVRKANSLLTWISTHAWIGNPPLFIFSGKEPSSSEFSAWASVRHSQKLLQQASSHYKPKLPSRKSQSPEGAALMMKRAVREQ